MACTYGLLSGNYGLLSMNYGLLSMKYGLLQGIVACDFGLLPMNHGLLEGIVACCFRLLGHWPSRWEVWALGWQPKLFQRNPEPCEPWSRLLVKGLCRGERGPYCRATRLCRRRFNQRSCFCLGVAGFLLFDRQTVP